MARKNEAGDSRRHSSKKLPLKESSIGSRSLFPVLSYVQERRDRGPRFPFVNCRQNPLDLIDPFSRGPAIPPSLCSGNGSQLASTYSSLFLWETFHQCSLAFTANSTRYRLSWKFHPVRLFPPSTIEKREGNPG